MVYMIPNLEYFVLKGTFAVTKTEFLISLKNKGLYPHLQYNTWTNSWLKVSENGLVSEQKELNVMKNGWDWMAEMV